MLKIAIAVVTGVLALVGHLIADILKKRKQIDGLPQPPMPNRLLGHLYLARECAELFPEDCHTHCWLDYIRTKYQLPEIFYVDWRPIGPLWMFVANPEATGQYITTSQCLPKSHLETRFMNRFLGDNNIVSLEGTRWKQLRSIFNPGFSATNIMNLTDYIVDSCVQFCEVMRKKADTNEAFELEEYTTALTIQIIGKAVVDVDLGAQEKMHPIVKYFRERTELMPPASAQFPWQGVSLLRPLRLWQNRRKLDGAIGKELDAGILRRAKRIEQERIQGTVIGPKKRSVLELALSTYEKEMAMGEGGMSKSDAVPHIMNLSEVPSALRRDLIDSVKTFVFAGHDTTSSMICWALYLLHRNPQVQEKLKAELDSFFPPGANAAEMIKANPHVINKLDYVTAVIKETLRLFPPASTLRAIRAPYHASLSSIIDPKTGKELPMAGCEIWPAAHLMHRNQRFFPRPTEFIPERFIPSQTPFPEAELFTAAGKEAFRPFEKGPRSCIGQELAMIEGRIILALTAREFDFTLEFPNEEADPQFPIPTSIAEEFGEDSAYGRDIRSRKIDRNRVEGHRLYQMLRGSAKPAGACPGRIKLR